jgi:hypothetical protein
MSAILNSVLEQYWNATKSLKRWRDSLSGANREFRSIVLSDHLRSAGSVRPVTEETAKRASAAAGWIYRAHDATPDDGVSYGYFPVSAARGWDVSYPETTGYIITTLIEYARRTGIDSAIERARRMAMWEAEIQMPGGAVQGGKLTTREKQTAATFNTGMVLDGFVTALENRPDAVILRAAERAAGFLVADMSPAGLFTTNGEFVTGDQFKIYNVLCAWALYRFGRLTGSKRHCAAAIAAVEGALRFQSGNGWFANNCLTDSNRPLTHTIGYTTQGILEVGLEAERDDFVAAVEKCFRALIPRIHANGFLPGRFDSDWRPAVRSSCLTGSAQLALIGYRLFQFRRESRYAQAADKLVNFLKGVQRVGTGIPGIDGALSGSFPIMGEYMSAGYPNWATKYLLDALMAQADYSGHSMTAADASSCPA